MTVKAFRIENFMCFEDSGWIEVLPITLFYGHNSSGKSALLHSLLLLRQSLGSKPHQSPLIFAPDDAPDDTDSFDFGSYRELVRDHDTDLSISFWFKCSFKEELDEESTATQTLCEGAALKKLGLQGTNVDIRLSYRLWPDERHVGLQSVALYDEAQDAFLDEEGELIWQATAPKCSDQPWRFAFGRVEPANFWHHTTLVVEEGFFPKLHSEEGQQESHPIGQLLCHLERSISKFFQTLSYLRPMRPSPQRFYHLPKQAEKANGQLFARLSSEEQQRAIKRINEWLAYSGIKVRLAVKPLDQDPTLYELLFSDTLTRRIPPFQANIREAGLGLYQVLPVVIETLLAPSGSTLLLEHPEQNLHPGVQAQLGDLFIQVAVRHKVRLLIETHSETLIIRMRRRIAESTLGYVSPSEKCYLPYEALKAYFVDRVAGESEVEMLYINSEGGLWNRPQGFKGFFADDLRETVALGKARLGK